MKQIISIADMATIYKTVNDTIGKLEEAPFVSIYMDQRMQLEQHKKRLKKNHYYQSLLRVKKTLENCNIKIEVPDIKVED